MCTIDMYEKINITQLREINRSILHARQYPDSQSVIFTVSPQNHWTLIIILPVVSLRRVFFFSFFFRN